MVTLEVKRPSPFNIQLNTPLFWQEMWQHIYLGRWSTSTEITQNNACFNLNYLIPLTGNVVVWFILEIQRPSPENVVWFSLYLYLFFNRKCGSMVTLEIQRPSPYNSPNIVCMDPNGPGSKSSNQSSCGSVQEFSIHDDRAFLLNQTNFVRFKPFQILSKLKSKSTFSLSLSRMQRLWLKKVRTLC